MLFLMIHQLKKLYYQPAGGGSGGISAVNAGTNISIPNPAVPVVSLQSPLTSQLNVGTQNITTTTVNGDINMTPNGTGAVHIQKSTASTNGVCRITQSSTGGASDAVLSLVNSNANNIAPHLDLYKNSSSPDNNDGVGTISFHGKNSAGAKTEYARIDAVSLDVSSTSGDGYLLLSRMKNNAISNGILIGDDISIQNNNLSAINIATAQRIICPNITPLNSTYPKYDSNTLEVKTDGIVSVIDAPYYDGQTFTGINGGRTPISWFRQIENPFGIVANCVVDFQGYLWWGGQNNIVQTNYLGVAQNYYNVGGAGQQIWTMCVGDAGNNLYIGGDFGSINGVACSNLAYIDNTLNVYAFTDINGDNGLNGVVYTIKDESAVFGGIWVGGAFTATGGSGLTTLNRIARNYVGATWDTHGIQIDNNSVYDIVRYQNGYEAMLIGGDFTSYGGGNSVNYILGYNLSSPSYFPVGSASASSYNAFNNKVYSLAKDANYIYVGGEFTDIDTNYRQYFATFTFTNQNDLQSADDFNNPVYSIVYNPTTGVVLRGGGGSFGIVGGTTYNGSPPFTIGLNINSRQAFISVGNQTFIPTNVNVSNYAYVYEPTSYTYWTTETSPGVFTPIVQVGGTSLKNVASPAVGEVFVLRGVVTGGIRWYIQSNTGVVFS